MRPHYPTIDIDLAGLAGKVTDEFSGWAIEGAEHALSGTSNPLRLNFFATAMRILFEHIMDTRSPEDQVVRCSWFDPEREDKKPTRWQRVIFAIQGGLTESFVNDELRVDIAPLRKRLLDSINELSKHVHGRENTILRDNASQAAVVQRTLRALGEFLDAMHACRTAVLEPIINDLDEAAVDTLISGTIQSVDELATHHSIEEVHVDRVTVHTIGFDNIVYNAAGSLAVVLQWGSNSDLRRGDGGEAEQSFPFTCEFEVSLDEPWNLRDAQPSYSVDTSKWTDAMAPDERDDFG